MEGIVSSQQRTSTFSDRVGRVVGTGDQPDRQTENPVNAMIAAVMKAFQQEKAADAHALVAAQQPGAHVDSLSEGIALRDGLAAAEPAPASLAPLATADDLAEAAESLLPEEEAAFGDPAAAVPSPLGLLERGRLAELMVSETAANQDSWDASGLLDDDTGQPSTASTRR